MSKIFNLKFSVATDQLPLFIYGFVLESIDQGCDIIPCPDTRQGKNRLVGVRLCVSVLEVMYV